jgi:hypothetical protein
MISSIFEGAIGTSEGCLRGSHLSPSPSGRGRFAPDTALLTSVSRSTVSWEARRARDVSRLIGLEGIGSASRIEIIEQY